MTAYLASDRGGFDTDSLIVTILERAEWLAPGHYYLIKVPGYAAPRLAHASDLAVMP